jgi:hypothetical protein
MAEFAYNNSEHTATKLISFYAFHGDYFNYIVRSKNLEVKLTDVVATVYVNKI